MSETASRILLRRREKKVRRCNNCLSWYRPGFSLAEFPSLAGRSGVWCLRHGKKVNPGWYGCSFHRRRHGG